LLLPIQNDGGTEGFAKLPYMPERKSQGETVGIFILMIPEIANQKVKISSTLKTCDMSGHIPIHEGNCSSVSNLKPPIVRLP
jgi:hypothetical protein